MVLSFLAPAARLCPPSKSVSGGEQKHGKKSFNGTVIILHSCPHEMGTDTAVLFRKFFMDKQQPQRRKHFGLVLLGLFIFF